MNRAYPLFVAMTLVGTVGVTAPVHAETAAEIFKRVSPAVVLIGIQGPGDSPAFGSGVVLTRDALVATNHHVVKSAKKILIRTSSEEILSNISLIAEDPTRDLAILFVPGLIRNPPALADSSNVEVGEDVLAIGHPEGLTHTLSRGIVSALRDLGNGRRFIQTTVALSSGSSGGPLLNMKGEIIGLAVGFLPEGQNLNFAIPSNDVRRLLNQARVVLKGPDDASGPAGVAGRRPPVEPIRLGRSNVTPGTTASISLDAGDFPFTYYLRQIQTKISERWTPPRAATRIGERVTILFQIGSDGRITEPVIERTSGNLLYNQSTLRALMEASPFPPLPPAYTRSRLRVSSSFVLEPER